MNDPRRRHFLRSLSALGGASLVTVAVEPAHTASERTHARNHAAIDAPDYRFLTTPEAAFLDAAVSCLIPADQLGPGAREAGVTVFIDRQLNGPWGVMANTYRSGPWVPGTQQQGWQSPLTPRELFRAAVRDIDLFCEKTHGALFAGLKPVKQVAVLSAAEKGELILGTVDAKEFFELLWSLTQEGFFADPLYGGNRDKVGWRLVGFPGVAAAYTDLIDRHGIPYVVEPVSIQDVKQHEVATDSHGHPAPPARAPRESE